MGKEKLMKVIKGILISDFIIWQVLVDGKKVFINTTSLWDKRNYSLGTIMEGVIMENKFNVCHKYYHAKIGRMFGYISRNKTNSMNVNITLVGDTESGEIVWVVKKGLSVIE